MTKPKPGPQPGVPAGRSTSVGLKPAAAFKMYVWRLHSYYLAVAHAQNVAAARALALEEWRGDGDWSTPVIKRAVEAIRNTNPEIHYRENAEVALCSNGEVEEQILYIDTLQLRCKHLAAALEAARETIHQWHGPAGWEIYDRSAPEMKAIHYAVEVAWGRHDKELRPPAKEKPKS